MKEKWEKRNGRSGGKAGDSSFQGSSACEPSQPSPLPRKRFLLPTVGLLSLEKSTLSLFLEPISSAFKCWLIMCSTLFGGGRVIFLKELRQVNSINGQQWQEVIIAHLAQGFQRRIKASFLLPASALSTGRQRRLSEREMGQSLETWVLVPAVSYEASWQVYYGKPLNPA